MGAASRISSSRAKLWVALTRPLRCFAGFLNKLKTTASTLPNTAHRPSAETWTAATPLARRFRRNRDGKKRGHSSGERMQQRFRHRRAPPSELELVEIAQASRRRVEQV